MKTEFMAAITQLSAERNLSKEVILSVLETALVSAYKKEDFSPEQDVVVKIQPESSEIKAYIRKTVAATVANPLNEISLSEAHEIRGDAQIGESVEIESTPKGAGRIAAQVARQVILQRLREAEHHAIYEQFIDKEAAIVTGTIQFIQSTQIHVALGRREAILPLNEQVPSERYHVGQQLKFYLLEISQGLKGPRLIISRSHPNLALRLFETEIPEIQSGVVELRGIAREAGHRSKVAVASHQEGADPVGCCLGTRGIRLQSIINQLNGEKIDVIQWDADPSVFIRNALSPAQVSSIALNEAEKTATVVVPDRQLSLAIGRGGQNARLAAKLTGWRIDIKSSSAAEAEKASLAPVAPEEAPSQKAAPKEVPIEKPVSAEIAPPEEKQDELVSAVASEAPEAEPVSEDEGKALSTLLANEVFRLAEPPTTVSGTAQIRFAEDIMPETRKNIRRKGKTKGKRHKKTGGASTS
ncbi:MAG: transcription termination factor NusA [Chloroflexota bacterium]|nr:transcription termination factor NusA [Chloroflexota bacterium]